MYICPNKLCGKTVTLEHRHHTCIGVRRLHGQVTNAETVYNPVSGNNKQSTVPGYMKKFGSRQKRIRKTDFRQFLV